MSEKEVEGILLMIYTVKDIERCKIPDEIKNIEFLKRQLAGIMTNLIDK